MRSFVFLIVNNRPTAMLYTHGLRPHGLRPAVCTHTHGPLWYCCYG